MVGFSGVMGASPMPPSRSEAFQAHQEVIDGTEEDRLKPVHVAEFKARGDFRAGLHGVKDFFRELQRSREFDAAEKQRRRQERKQGGKPQVNKGGYYPYLQRKEQRQQSGQP